MRLASITLAACLAAGAAHAATVDVSLARSVRLTDAGASPWDEQETVDTLARHLERLGQRHLPAQQSLKIELLDVDLAGSTRLMRRSGQELRLLKGGADVPRITLRYTLMSDGRVLRSGEDVITDLDYLRRPLDDGYSSESLPHEKRLLDTWFRERFAPAPG